MMGSGAHGRRALGLAIAGFIAVLVLIPAAAQAAPGDVYVADEDAAGIAPGEGAIFRIGPAGGAATRIAASPSWVNPSGMVMNRDGSLLVTDYETHAGTIYQVSPATGDVSIFASGAPLVTPVDLAFGPDGMLYVTDFGTTPPQIVRLDPNTRAETVIATGSGDWTDVSGIAVARNGTIYFSDYEDEVFRRDPVTGAVAKLAENPVLDGSDGLALSPDDRTLYVAGFGNGTNSSPPNHIAAVDTRTGVVSLAATTDDSVAVSLLPDGSLLNSDTDDGADQFAGIQRFAGGVPGTFSGDAQLSYPHDTVVEPSRCGGLIPTVVGTTGPDKLTGSPFADVFSTLGGKDKVKAGGGNDVVCGGGGKDTLVGQAGRDRLLGEKGADLLKGGKGKDVCKGGKGTDKGSSCEKGKLG